MAKNNRTCANCGKRYHYCPTCTEDQNKPTWMSSYCSENCKNLFVGATDYFAGLISKEKAKDIVYSADLKNINKFHHGVVKFINTIKSMFDEKEKKTQDNVELKEQNKQKILKQSKENKIDFGKKNFTKKNNDSEE